MAYRQPSTPSVQQTAHKPIRFSAHQVALMAQFANELSPEFCRTATPHLTPAFIGFYLETLAADPTPYIPPCFLSALNLKPNRKGEFTWIPR
jgi:hypothetical protein